MDSGSRSDDAYSRDLVDWSASILGKCEIVSGDARIHGRSSVSRLKTASGRVYLKIHEQRASWETEVHGYERWSRAFEGFTPKLLATRDEPPFALIVTELRGVIADDATLTDTQERAMWRDAGNALAKLHRLEVGGAFGECGRDGACLSPISDAREFIANQFDRRMEGADRHDLLTDDERAVIDAARELIPAFEGERPTPCHRDYGPANWIVRDDGAWGGVIDYEFAHWDVRVADFSRYPGWEWLRNPHLIDVFFEGYDAAYGRSLTQRETQQMYVGHALYALGAVVWGSENEFFGFMDEGRQGLKALAERLC